MGIGLSQQQNVSQVQSMKLSQQQIQGLTLLGLNAFDLRSEIYDQIEKNPALMISEDGFENGVEEFQHRSSRNSDTVKMGKSSSYGDSLSSQFQSVLENTADSRETLYDSLIHQLGFLKLTDAQKELCTRLIGNLDSEGFHILAPASLLNNLTSHFEGDPVSFLDSCIEIVRTLEPSGICCKNIEESLLVQAKKNGAGFLELFLLDGHLSFLDPPVPSKVLKKINSYIAERKQMAFNSEDFSFMADLEEPDVAEAVDFIKSLNPHPAAGYEQSQSRYVVPDVIILPAASEDGEGEGGFSIQISDDVIPSVIISPDYEEIKKMSKNLSADVRKSLDDSIKSAKNFMESLAYRESTILKASHAILHHQLEFFKKGPGHLVPMVQQEIADEIGVHNSTVSRMASEKYIQCEWGLFPVKYFFSNSVGNAKDVESKTSSGQNVPLSKEAVKFKIAEILKANEGAKKPLSDQKVSDALMEMGIKVARRTVAKYRAELNINSSYERNL